jgi:hypothetical protein
MPRDDERLRLPPRHYGERTMSGTELTCVIHVHSVYSDGTGTVPEIAAATAASGADVVIVTDHDDVRAAGHAGWLGDVLVIAGHEVSPLHGSHLLALGTRSTIAHVGRTARAVLDAVHAHGGLGFAAHPFSRGGWILGRAGRAAPYADVRAPLDGIELWSLVTDTLEYLRSPLDLARFRRDPDSVLADPPDLNLAAWDALGLERRVAAIGGLDAHQYGVRRGERVWVRTMGYAQTFGLLRTHALLEMPVTPGEDAPEASALVLRALAAGHCFLARDSLADATGFTFGPGMGDERPFEEPLELVAVAPRECTMRLWHDGELAAEVRDTTQLHHIADGVGVWRVSAHLEHAGRERTWVLTNPVYLR